MDQSEIKLSDLKGKIVFLDVWATWCGPCVRQRPRVIALANKYKNNLKIEMLRISVDQNRDIWIKYLQKKNQLDLEGELIIENGMRKEFGNRYNISEIPKYILIDAEGIIINSNISEPSLSVEQMIENELNKMENQ